MSYVHLAVAVGVAWVSAGCSVRDVVIGARGDVTPAVAMPSGGASKAAQDAGARRAAAAGHEMRAGSGCGQPGVIGEMQVLGDAGVATYLVDLPAQYDVQTAYPLVFAFRSSEDNVATFRASLGLVPVAGDAAILVHAETPNAASLWNVSRDVPYFDAMLEQLVARYCVDLSRVFVVGHAQGGMLASALACQRGARIRAGALFAGTTPMGTCQGAVAMFVAQGNMDSVYPLRSGRGTRDAWARNNQCDVAASRAVAPTPCVEYADCISSSPLRYCEYAGGHALPDFAASAVWSFFTSLQ